MAVRVPFQIPPGLNGDDTTYSANARYADCSNVRFWRGRPQTINGWEAITPTTLTGVCRSVFGWTNNASVLNIAFGTHSNLQLYQGGAIYDITPKGPPTLLGANPLAVTNGSPTVTVTHTAHGIPNGTSTIFAGSAAIGGITPNGTFAITVIDADHYSYTFSSNATSTVAAGGGSAVIVTPQMTLPAGVINGTGNSGFGTGTYSTGTYSSPSTVEYFSRTWSLSNWGQELIANPRNGAIYNWVSSTGTPAVALTNAPPQVTYAFVSQSRQVFALGCNQEASPYTFDPLVIRHSSVGNNNDWTTTTSSTAREYRLPSGGRIVCGSQFGQYVLIWTASSLFLGTYVGSLGQVWRFDKVGDECGIIGPNAFTIVGQQAFWVGPNLQIYTYTLGDQCRLIACPIQSDFAGNMAPSQTDKIVVSSVSPFNELRIDYPDARDGNENSRYIAAHIPTLLGSPENAWYRGIMGRTAFVDTPASSNSYPIGVDYSGGIYWHEKGNSANGGQLTWFIETADNYLDPNTTMMIRAVWPDFKNQIGPVNFKLIGRFTPQGSETSTTTQSLSSGQEKADIRMTTRLAKIRYDGSSSPTFVRFGNPTFDVVPAGLR